MPHLLDRFSNKWIMRTPKYNRLYIRGKFREIVMKQYFYLRSRYDTLLYKWYKSWCGDFFDDHALIEDMDTLTVHTSPHCSFCRENSDLPISSLHYRLSSWHGHTEYISSYIYFLLKPPQGMHTRCITSKDDDIGSSSIELLDSPLREHTNLLSTSSSIWSIFSIHFEDHFYTWKLLLENFHDDQPTESWVKKSNNHILFRKLIFSNYEKPTHSLNYTGSSLPRNFTSEYFWRKFFTRMKCFYSKIRSEKIFHDPYICHKSTCSNTLGSCILVQYTHH